MKKIKLVTPKKQEENKWWEEYSQLSSSEFTDKNAGRTTRELQPYTQSINGELKPAKYISQIWNIIGYTLNPPFEAPFESVAIMFERKDDFERVWFHYVK